MNRVVAVSVAIAVMSVVGASHPGVPGSRSFLFVEKNDTGGGETFTRSENSISGDMRIGRDHAHYEGRVAADGTIPRLEIRASRSGSTAGSSRLMSIVVGHDGALLIERAGRKVDTLRLRARPGAIPVINPSMGLLELVVARARSQKSRITKVPILFIDALNLDKPRTSSLRARVDTGTIDVTFAAGDSIRLGYRGSKDQLRVLLGPDGRIRGAASGTTAKDRFAAIPTSKPAGIDD